MPSAWLTYGLRSPFCASSCQSVECTPFCILLLYGQVSKRSCIWCWPSGCNGHISTWCAQALAVAQAGMEVGISLSFRQTISTILFLWRILARTSWAFLKSLMIGWEVRMLWVSMHGNGHSHVPAYITLGSWSQGWFCWCPILEYSSDQDVATSRCWCLPWIIMLPIFWHAVI